VITRSSVVRLLLAVSWIACSESDPALAPTEPAAAGARAELILAAPAAIGEHEQWRVARRLVAVRTAVSLPPSATIRDETRPVLQGFEAVTLNYAPRFPVPADGRVAFDPPLPAQMQADRVFLSIRVQQGDRWVSLPGQLVPATISRGRLRVDVDFDLTSSAGKEAGVWVQAMDPGSSEAPASLGAAFVVPDRARLDFAIGILEPAWGAGPVGFEIAACSGPEDAACEPLFRRTVDPADDGQRGFLEHSLGLQSLAGRRVALRFIAKPIAAGARSLPVFANPIVVEPVMAEPVARGGSSHNLILISLDTLRADHMGSYGYERDTTPFLDELAREGVLFERYVAASSSTRPSHMTMFTSLQPSVHGTTENTGVRTLPLGATTLAERLQESGIATGAFTENGAIDLSRGFGRGFDVYVENRDASRADLRTGQIEQTFADGLAWLDRVSERRFFLFLHTYQVHNPFTPPTEYEDFFADDAAVAPPGLRADWDPRLYDREIRYADDRVRALVAELRGRGLLDDSYLVITSDHGEAFLEHDFVAHGANVHHEVLNVPWIVTGPGLPAGHRIKAPVPMVDLMPTILELMGVSPSGGEMGRSQAGAIRREGELADEPRAIYSEAWSERAYRRRGFERIPQPTIALRLGDRKIVRARVSERPEDGHRYELYDLAADPREEIDLFPKAGGSAADLQKLLDRYEATAKELHKKLGEPADGPTTIDPDLREKLEALGYLDPAGPAATSDGSGS
jgi:arylsulfatase A-like enzyme